MKCFATPAPNFASTHSSKFLNARSLSIVCDSTRPIRHSSIACSGSEERWFWNGYRTYLSSNLIQLSRSIQRMPSLPRTLPRKSLKYL